MSDIKVYNKKIAGSIDRIDPVYAQKITMAETRIGRDWKTAGQSALWTRAFNSGATVLGASGTDYSKADDYGGAIHVPQRWSDGKVESAFARVTSGRKPQKPLLPATRFSLIGHSCGRFRMDITVRKNANPTVRQFLYNIYNRPTPTAQQADRNVPYGIASDEYNEPATLYDRATRAKAHRNFDVKIYAAGFTGPSPSSTSLLTSMLADGAAGYNAKLDDLAIKPILDHNYGSADAKHTKAATTNNADVRNFCTIRRNAIDDRQAHRPATK